MNIFQPILSGTINIKSTTKLKENIFWTRCNWKPNGNGAANCVWAQSEKEERKKKEKKQEKEEYFYFTISINWTFSVDSVEIRDWI